MGTVKKKVGSRTKTIPLLIVRKAPRTTTRGLLQAGRRVLPCALGRSGIGAVKREGDGRSPHGSYRLLSAMFRADRTKIRKSRLPARRITAAGGWCDAVGHRLYNRPVTLPFPASHEKLKRKDHLYDLVIVMDHNISRHMTRGGSAIFFHLAHDDYRPTEGCVAISPAHMHWLWPRLGTKTRLVLR